MAQLRGYDETAKERRSGIYVSRCAALSVALFNAVLLVACTSLLLTLRGTSPGVEVHRVARQFAGAGTDRQPGARDPDQELPGDMSPEAIACRSLEPNALLRICNGVMSTASMPQSSTRSRRVTPAPLSLSSSSSSSSTKAVFENDDAPDNLRLPRQLRPYHYSVRWTPDFYDRSPRQFTLNGSASIYFRCHSPSAVISLNYRRLLISGSSVNVTSVRDKAGIPVIRIDENPGQEVYNITMSRSLMAGEEVVVNLSFFGSISDGPNGIYWSQYSAANGTKYLVSTQFETTLARQAFPCVDDPSAKATFTLSIDRQTQMTTVANTPLNYTVPNTRNPNWVTDVFVMTKAMSTYLVAFVISEYTNVTVYSKGMIPTKIGCWAQSDFVTAGYVNYSSIIAPSAVDFFGNYFDYPYNWPKMDMVSVPTMSFGGMENWGLITYQPNRLLFDETKSDSEDRLNLAVTVSHEILHNWLGNLVTIKWWDDLWLTEGTARYFQYLGIQNAQPTWDVDQLFVYTAFYSGAMWNDDSASADPVYNWNLSTNADLDDMFSSITYNKGGTVIRMLAKLIVGENVFRDAFKKYIKDYEYGNVEHKDLFNEMSEAYRKSGGVMDFDVTEVLSTWILQQGFPLVTVKRSQNATSTSLVLTQNLFLYPLNATVDGGNSSSPYGYLWEIPITCITSNNPNPAKVWMHKDRQIVVPLSNSLTASDWVLVNHNVYGYYRVNYDNDNWLALAAQLKTDHTKIPINNRAQLIEDSFTLSMSGNLSQTIGLKLTEYLSNEVEYLPWILFHDNFAPLLRKISSNTQLYTRMQNYLLSRLQNGYNRFGWDASAADGITAIFLRRIILEFACGAANNACVSAALERFQRWKANGFNNNSVTPDQRFAVYCTVAAHGSYDDWQVLASRYQATLSHFSGESDKLAEALTCTRNISIIASLLQAVQNQQQNIVSYRDYYKIVYYIALTTQGYSSAWDHLNRYGINALGRVDMLKSFSSVIATAEEYAKFDSYVRQYPPQNDYEASSFESYRQLMQQNINWRQRNEQSIADWLMTLGF